MRWKGRRRSANVEDRRGRGVGPARRRLPGGRPVALGGGAMFLVVLIGLLLGGDPAELMRLLGDSGAPHGASVPGSGSSRGAASAPPAGDEQAEFVSVVLADTEHTWDGLFRGLGREYRPPRLVLFDEMVRSACGMNSAAVGPFYCPADRQVYIDLSFFRDLSRRFGAPGDFAQAYVIAHEVGHHVQNMLGVSDQIANLRRRASQAEGNALSVRQELQADCFAGVWGHHAGTQRQLLERGDVEEGLRAAAAIGDDRMQRMSSGRVSPESWTHGSSEQRVRWFRRGLETGRVDACDTFAASSI